MGTKLVQTRVPDATATGLKTMAVREGLSVADYIRRLLIQHVDGRPDLETRVAALEAAMKGR